MLGYSKLPHKFWAEALSTAVYLRNRSPTKAVEAMTPFEAWVGEKPNVGHLRTFGCVAYAHVAKDERKKLDSKARKCIFLGTALRPKDTDCMIQNVKKSSLVEMWFSMKRSVE